MRWFSGVPSPVREPQLVDMVIFRENTEDIYAGLEVESGSSESKRLIELLHDAFGWEIRADAGVGIKPVSKFGSQRLQRAALVHAVRQGRKRVHWVHKGNIMKFTEGAFRNWGYELVREEFSDVAVAWEDCGGDPGDKILVQDTIADIALQQVLTRPAEFDVIATMNLNGDYISDALAAQVGGIGIAPGRQHQLRDRSRRVRGHPRHRPQVRRPRQGEPVLGAAVGGSHVRTHRLAERRGRHHHRGGGNHQATA